MSQRLPTLALGLLTACRSCDESPQEDGGSAGLDAEEAVMLMDNGAARVREILEDNGGTTPELDDVEYQLRMEELNQERPAKQ